MASQLYKDLMEGLAEVAELEDKPELAKTIRYERDTFDESLNEEKNELLNHNNDEMILEYSDKYKAFIADKDFWEAI